MDPLGDCPRHPGRPSLTVCSRCGRGICADEPLVDAPVGYQCTDCTRSAPPARRLMDGPPPAVATRAMVGALVAVALLEAAGLIDVRTYGLVPLLVGIGQWWRLVTSALMHAGVAHLAFNALLLWHLGTAVEAMVGRARLVGLTVSGLAGGSLGVVVMAWLTAMTRIGTVPLLGPLLATDPRSLTVGASGAVFGLMGAVLGVMRAEGTDPRTTPLGSMVGSLVAINLVLTFLIPFISIGGHVGGLAAGWVAGRLVAGGGRGRTTGTPRSRHRTALLPILLAGALLVAATALAGTLVMVPRG